MADYQYTQIDVATRLNAVKARIREIETQYMQLSLRVVAPDLNVPTTERENANLQRLQQSLDALHQMEAELESAASA